MVLLFQSSKHTCVLFTFATYVRKSSANQQHFQCGYTTDQTQKNRYNVITVRYKKRVHTVVNSYTWNDTPSHNKI